MKDSTFLLAVETTKIIDNMIKNKLLKARSSKLMWFIPRLYSLLMNTLDSLKVQTNKLKAFKMFGKTTQLSELWLTRCQEYEGLLF